MTPVAVLVLGCAWISDADRDLRWDADQDGVERPADCDDADPAVSPRAAERCDDRDVDEDCDGAADDLDDSVLDPDVWCADLDGDGAGDPANTVASCEPPGAEWLVDCSDCDDGDPVTTCETPTDTGSCGALPVADLVTSERVGEQGVTHFVTDASGSSGTELEFGFDWGDGSGVEATGRSPAGDHVYTTSGWFPLTVTVEDDCGRTASDEVWVAVSPPGGLLEVGTATDEADVETHPPADTGYLGTGLSLREALVLAQGMEGAQVVTFAPDLDPVATGLSMPALTDDGGILVGAGTVLDGAAGGRIDVQGAGAVVAELELVGFTDPTLGAVYLSGGGAVAHGVTVRDSALGLRVDGFDAVVREVGLYGSATTQLVVSGRSLLRELDVAGGAGVGVSFDASGADSDLMLSRIHGNGGSGVVLERDADGVSILDSTIVGNGAHGVFGSSSPPIDGLDLRNVIIAYNAGSGVDAKGQSFVDGSPSYDLWFQNGGGDCPACGSLGDGSITVDPLFAGPEAGDFTLLPGSPVVDAGTDATGVDRNGPTEGAWYGAAPDIGATEAR